MKHWWVVLALAACAPVPDTPRSEPIPFQLDAKGVQLLDRSQRIDFGRTDHSTIPAMTKLIGKQPKGVFECTDGGQIVIWPDGTSLIMKRGAFRGWVSTTLSNGAGATCNPGAALS